MKKLFILFLLCAVSLSSVAKEKEKFYLSRIQFGYLTERYSNYFDDGDHIWAHGLDLGYLANIKVGGKLPLYVYTGMLTQADFAVEETRHMSFEMPFGATYRFKLGDTKIYLSPYAGFHLKANLLWNLYDDGDWFNMFDENGTNRIQFGAQTGFNFDLGPVFWNFEFNGDLNKAYKYGSWKCGTMGFRFRFGFVF